MPKRKSSKRAKTRSASNTDADGEAIKPRRGRKLTPAKFVDPVKKDDITAEDLLNDIDNPPFEFRLKEEPSSDLDIDEGSPAENETPNSKLTSLCSVLPYDECRNDFLEALEAGSKYDGMPVEDRPAVSDQQDDPMPSTSKLKTSKDGPEPLVEVNKYKEIFLRKLHATGFCFQR